MDKPSIVDFIAEKRTEGKTDSEITHLLLDAGWHMDIINKTIHNDEIKKRNFEPILDIKKQPLRKPVVVLVAAFAVLIALALVAAFI